MLLRIWRTEFDPERIQELREFAATRSEPMFESFPGCQGFVFAHDHSTYVTMSLWRDAADIAEAEATALYQETVAALLASEMLLGPQTVEIFDIDTTNLINSL